MNYSKQSDWFDIQLDDSSKIITIRQRWLYKWAHDLGQQHWSTEEERFFTDHVSLLINLFWRAIPKLRVKGTSSFARQNANVSYQVRLEVEQSPTHPLIGNPHWTIQIYKKRDCTASNSAIHWHRKEVILDLEEVFGKQTAILNPLKFSTQSYPKRVTGGISISDHSRKVTAFSALTSAASELQSDYLSNYFDIASILNTGLTLRQLNFDYLLREINKILPSTVFYSDFSTEFDYHSILTRQIVTTAPNILTKSASKRINTLSVFERFSDIEPKKVKDKKEPKVSKLKKREYGNVEAGLTNTVPSKKDLNPKDKPKYSPSIKKWYKKGGRIEVIDNGNWKYIDWEGNEVVYHGDFPNFDPYVRQQVEIENMEGNCTTDFRKANKKASQKILPSNTWHHHHDLKTMQEMPADIHDRFTHYGACAILGNKPKKKGVAIQKNRTKKD